MAPKPSTASSADRLNKPAIQVQPCRYQVGKTLGGGSYSVVKECVHIETGRYYAAKIINKKLMAGKEQMLRGIGISLAQVKNEIAVLQLVSMEHKHILTLVDYFETMNNLYLITDLALGGELFDRICRKGSYYESHAAKLIRCTLAAVDHLHERGIVHRDLKPENLLFRTPADDSDLVVADFGLSRVVNEQDKDVYLYTTCGTPSYMAPEILRKTGHGKPVDMWAIGVITFLLLCGYTPFDRDNDNDEMAAILAADYNFNSTYWNGISDEAKDFVSRCLIVNPQKRMTAKQALAHPFVNRPENEDGDGSNQHNLGPAFRENFNARRVLHSAIDTVRAINKLREGINHDNMQGGLSSDPTRYNAPAQRATGHGNDSGYATQKGTPDDRSQNSSGSAGPSLGDVPASLRPGSDVNRVLSTSAGLWSRNGNDFIDGYGRHH